MTPSGPVSYLAHDFAPEKSLRGWLESDWRPDEAEILRIDAFLLDVLGYFHALHPAVIHRDVKPANVIRSEEGRLWLVDFGAVRDATTDAAGGYMAPERPGDPRERHRRRRRDDPLSPRRKIPDRRRRERDAEPSVAARQRRALRLDAGEYQKTERRGRLRPSANDPRPRALESSRRAPLDARQRRHGVAPLRRSDRRPRGARRARATVEASTALR
jgi:serine/threonine protein kinase